MGSPNQYLAVLFDTSSLAESSGPSHCQKHCAFLSAAKTQVSDEAARWSFATSLSIIDLLAIATSARLVGGPERKPEKRNSEKSQALE